MPFAYSATSMTWAPHCAERVSSCSPRRAKASRSRCWKRWQRAFPWWRRASAAHPRSYLTERLACSCRRARPNNLRTRCCGCRDGPTYAGAWDVSHGAGWRECSTCCQPSTRTKRCTCERSRPTTGERAARLSLRQPETRIVKLLLVTPVFPSPLQPQRGAFNFEMVRAFTPAHDVRVIAPIAWPVALRARWQGRQWDDTRHVDGIEVRHPVYFYTPRTLRTQ